MLEWPANTPAPTLDEVCAEALRLMPGKCNAVSPTRKAAIAIWVGEVLIEYKVCLSWRDAERSLGQSRGYLYEPYERRKNCPLARFMANAMFSGLMRGRRTGVYIQPPKPPPDDDSPAVPLEELAVRLGYTVRTSQRWVSRDGLPTIGYRPRKVRINTFVDWAMRRDHMRVTLGDKSPSDLTRRIARQFPDARNRRGER